MELNDYFPDYSNEITAIMEQHGWVYECPLKVRPKNMLEIAKDVVDKFNKRNFIYPNWENRNKSKGDGFYLQMFHNGSYATLTNETSKTKIDWKFPNQEAMYEFIITMFTYDYEDLNRVEQHRKWRAYAKEGETKNTINKTTRYYSTY